MNKILTAISAAALIISGCSKIQTPIPEDGLMQFDVAHPATTKATETAFEAGDKIGVYITGYEGDKPLTLELGGNYKNNNAVTFDGAKWNATPAIYWGDKFTKFDVYAYYPFGNPQSVDEMVFDVATDQSIPKTETSLSTYEASDFLFASKKGVTSADGIVNLMFKHKMSKLTVKLKKGPDYEGDLPATKVKVMIHNTVTSSLIDLSTGDVIKHPQAPAKTITAKQMDFDRYTAIVVPQMINYKQPLIEIVCNNVSYMIESRFQFKTGTHHTINVTLNNDPEKVQIEIGGEIQGGWN